MRAILLMMIGASFALALDTFTDSMTGLIWQDNSAAKETKLNWQDAKRYCSELTLAGKSDWRLPTIYELKSIVDITRYDPAIKKGIKHTNSDYYWSSSQYVSNDKYAWHVNFMLGGEYNYTKTYEVYVRCVRGRQ